LIAVPTAALRTVGARTGPAPTFLPVAGR
jgi:hypothetical protein